MRITCPHCGERHLEEFLTLGTVPPQPRPALDALDDYWNRYVYERDNPAGLVHEYWQHLAGCRSWLIVTRDTRSHTILSVEPAGKAAP